MKLNASLSQSLLGLLAAGSLLVAACASGPRATPRVAPKAAYVFTGTEFERRSENSEARRLAEDGCHFLSADGSQVACLTHELDMGHATSVVSIHNLSKARTTVRKFTIFKGMGGESKGLQQAEIAKVNAIFKAGGFAVEGAVNRGPFTQLTEDGASMRWTFDGKSASSTRPVVFKSQGAATQKCCRFEPNSATHFKRANVVGITFDMSCRFHADASKGQECFVADYNDESRPLDTRVRLVRLPN